MRPGVQPFLGKWVSFAGKWKIISCSKVEHLTSFRYGGPGELGNGLLIEKIMFLWLHGCLFFSLQKFLTIPFCYNIPMNKTHIITRDGLFCKYCLYDGTWIAVNYFYFLQGKQIDGSKNATEGLYYRDKCACIKWFTCCLTPKTENSLVFHPFDVRLFCNDLFLPLDTNYTIQVVAYQPLFNLRSFYLFPIVTPLFAAYYFDHRLILKLSKNPRFSGRRCSGRSATEKKQ